MKIENVEPVPGQLNSEKPAAGRKEFWALNWLRFVVALYIVLFHTMYSRYAPLKDTAFDKLFGLGNWGTSIFFVLSGFLLTHVYVVMKDGRPFNKRNFLTARLSTLYPLHAVALLFALVPIALMVHAMGGLYVPTELSGPGKRMLGTAEIGFTLFMNFAMLHAWNPYYLIINYPSWSISTLMFFYLLFPVLAPKVYRMKYPVYGLVILGILFTIPGAIAHFTDRNDVVTDGLLHRNPVIRLPLFVAGMVLCVLFARSSAPAPKKLIVALAGVVLATLAIALSFQGPEYHPHLLRNGLYYPASLAIIWLCVCVRPTTNGALKYWGARLGSASLPMFLLHAPTYMLFEKVEKLVRAVAQNLGAKPSAILAAARDIDLSLAFYPLYVVSLVILCVVVQERFVIPVQAKIRNRLSSRTMADALDKEARTGTA